MANRVIWAPGLGAGLTWSALTYTGTPFNSLAGGSCVTNLTAITNGTAFDLYMDVSYTTVNGATTTTAASRAFCFLLPLNGDGTTYGDNSQTLGTSTATNPVAGYQVGALGNKVGVASGTALVNTFREIRLPPGTFVVGVVPNTEGALNATASANVWYRTYVENLNG